MAPADPERDDVPPDRPDADPGKDGSGVDCPSASAWERVRATAGDTIDEAFLAHLGGCRACSERFAAIAAEWSRADIAAEMLDDPEADTRALVARLAAALPPGDARRRPPAIDGLDDLVETGRGGMGIVYRAHERRLGRVVAVKVLATGSATSPDARARAEREARLLARIVHPNIVRIHSVIEVEGAPALVMEWIDGPSLADRGPPGVAALRDSVALLRDLARAVAALHDAGVVHRDIKPANVLLARASGDGRGVPKLVDFGLARPELDASAVVTRPSVAVGTPSFMAPEQTGLDAALGAVGPATDIHGLGALLYWLLSGRAPYDGQTTAAALQQAVRGDCPPLSAIVPRLPADVGTIVATCLARQPERRYRSAAALADDLDRFLDGRPILARRPSVVERSRAWARRRPVAAALAASALLAAVASVAGVAFHVRRLEAARAALAAKRDEAIAAAGLARESFERLTDSTAERFLARGNALDAADRDHLRRIRDRYREWPLEPDEEAALHFRAAGLFRLTTLFDSLHWKEDAAETGRDCRACLDELERRGIAAADETSRRHLLERMERSFLVNAGRLGEAIETTRAGIARLATRVAVEPALERHLAVARADLGNLEGKAGHLAAARAEQEQAVAMFDRLVAADPSDAELSRLSLTVLYNAAINAAFADDPAARRAFLATLVDRSTEGLERFPEEPGEFGRGLLLGLAVLAHLDFTDGRPGEALAKERRRAAIARELAEASTHRQRFLDEVIAAAAQTFRCLEALGRPGDAAAELDEADALATEAVASEPAVRQRTWVLVDILVAKASMQLATGRRAEAIATHRRLLDALLPWSKGDGAAEPFQVTVADVQATIERLEAE